MEYNKKRVKSLWSVFLIFSGKTTSEIATDTNQSQQNLSQKCIIRPLCTRNPRSGYRESNKAVPTIRYCSTAS